jgi:hypothetical protein
MLLQSDSIIAFGPKTGGTDGNTTITEDEKKRDGQR